MANPIAEAFLQYSRFGSWQVAVFTGIALAAMINAASWLWASFTGDEKLKAWVRREASQMVFSVIIALFCVALVTGPFLPELLKLSAQASGDANWQAYVFARCALPTGPGAQQMPCHIALAMDYLDVLFKMGENLAQSTLSAYTFLAFLQSASLEVKGMQDTSSILTFNPLIGLSLPVDTLAGVFDLTVKNMMAIRFQQFFIDMWQLAFFPFFLSIGLILRSVYFTRRLGGLFIALSLCFYIIFPMTYVLFHAVAFKLLDLDYGTIDPAKKTNFNTLNAIYLDWAMQGGKLDAEGAFQMQGTLDDVEEGVAIYNESGAIAINNVAGVKTIRPTEKWFTGKDAAGTSKEYVARELGGMTIVSFAMPTPGGQLSFDQNVGTGGSFDFGNRPKYLDMDFRKKYGDMNDPAWRSNPENATEFGSKILVDICPSVAVSDAEKARRQEIIGTAQGYWLKRLYQGYAGGFYIMIDPIYEGGFLGRNGPLDNLAKLLVLSLIVPFIALMAALAGVKAFSPMIGGDVEIAGLTRLL